MEEHPSQRVRELKSEAQAKAMVVEATVKALERIDTLHHIGKANVLLAKEAAARDLAEYENAGQSAKIADLKNIAQDAVEGLLRELGYTDLAMIADFNAILDKELLLPESEA